MSASLVGSEMCIRDSAVGDAARGDDDHGEAPERGLSSQPTPARAAHAVSYTHLTLPTICSV
eukprot:674530-Alexandrium_andersonii.AAC.1